MPTRSRTIRELRVQLVILAAALWTVAAVNSCTPTRYLRSGQLKGTDFVQFYALASAAARGEADRFSDFDFVHGLQLTLVPESKGLIYPTVYGPQIAVTLAPLGRLSYDTALVVWLALTSVACMGLVTLVALESPAVRPYLGTALVGLAAFPPFWQLIQHGHLSWIAMVAIVTAWLALRRGHETVAGLCLGILAYKPPLLAPVLLVLAAARAWRPLSAAVVAGGAQILAFSLLVGPQGLGDYVRQVLSLPGSASMLAVKPERMHSLRTFWELLIPWSVPALVLYGVSAAGAAAAAAAVWRREVGAPVRMAALCLATVLAAPHLYVYDLVLLAPAWIWLIDWHVRGQRRSWAGKLLYVGFVAPLVSPLVPLMRVQISTLCFAGLLWLLYSHERDRAIAPAPARPAVS